MAALNHPKKGDSIKVEPIKAKKDIQNLKKLLSDKPRDLAIFVVGINTNLRASDLLRIKVGQVIATEGQVGGAEESDQVEMLSDIRHPMIGEQIESNVVVSTIGRGEQLSQFLLVPLEMVGDSLRLRSLAVQDPVQACQVQVCKGDLAAINLLLKPLQVFGFAAAPIR